ncbi:MAG: hypothetical protein JSR57_02670 [Verrucomicrobia bacterium]|nr:hypothetical protein [Verrucomicrobiota bacterium]
MERLIFIHIAIFSLLTNSCSQPSNNYTEPAHVKAADKVTSRCTKKIQKEHNIQLIGSGGSMMDDIRKIFLHFTDNKPHTIEQARKLIIQITEEILLEFNSDEDVRQYLYNFPFTPSNIEIMLSFKRHESNSAINSIDFVSKGPSTIDYYNFDKNKEKYVEVSEEPYEEALQKLHQNDSRTTRPTNAITSQEEV